jgi:DNA-binding beta-propeller fold protein YncE
LAFNNVYVANAQSNDVSVFTIGSSGGLTPVSGSPFATGLAEVRAMGTHGTQNTFLTVVGNGGVADFPLDASGHLGTPKLTTENVPADITSITSGPGLVYLLSAAGLDAYVERSVPGSSDCLDVPFDCKLTATSLPVGSQPSSVAVSEHGVFVSNAGSHDLTAFRIQDDGGLGVSFTPLANTPTGLGPSSTYPYWPPSFVWVTNELSNSLSVFRFNTNDNTLTQVSGSPVATGTGPVAVAIP